MQSQLLIADRRRARRGHPIRRNVADAQVLDFKRREDNDLRLFVLSFTAFFICFYSFIF